MEHVLILEVHSEELLIAAIIQKIKDSLLIRLSVFCVFSLTYLICFFSMPPRNLAAVPAFDYV